MSEKIFEPPPERLRKAQIEGTTRRSQQAAQAALVLVVLLFIKQHLSRNWVRFKMLLQCMWSRPTDVGGECLTDLIEEVHYSMASLAALMLFVVVCVHLAQVGFLWLPAAVAPSFQRFNIVKGASKIVSGLQQLPVVMAKGILAAAVTLGFAWVCIPQLLLIIELYPEQQSVEVLYLMYRYTLVGAAVFLLAGSFDVYQQRKRFKDQVFMDYEEMKREHREQEGDPHLKAHRRALHQSLSRQQMIEQIKRSKVIIVERR